MFNFTNYQVSINVNFNETLMLHSKINQVFIKEIGNFH